MVAGWCGSGGGGRFIIIITLITMCDKKRITYLLTMLQDTFKTTKVLATAHKWACLLIVAGGALNPEKMLLVYGLLHMPQQGVGVQE